MGEYSHHALYAARRRLGGSQGTCPHGMHNHRGSGLDRRGRSHPRLPRAGGVNRRHGGQGCQCGRRAQEILLLQHFHLRRGYLLLLRDALWSGLDCHRGLPAVLLCPLCRLDDHNRPAHPRPRPGGRSGLCDYRSRHRGGHADDHRGLHGRRVGGYDRQVVLVPLRHGHVPARHLLARTFRETVITRKDPEMIELYGKIAWLTIIMWSFYPVVWLFSEGFASFSVSFEVVAYTILDIISKVVFSFMIVSAHDSLGSTSAPQMQSREYV